MAIYMHYDGIKGDATEDGHKDWIQVDSFQFGVGRGIATAGGASKNREASEASVSEVVITKALDASTPDLFRESLIGKAGKVVKIDFLTTSGGTDAYLQYTLTNTLVSGYSQSSGGDRPSESISLNFTKVEMKTNTLAEDNKTPKPITVSYDIATAKAS